MPVKLVRDGCVSALHGMGVVRTYDLEPSAIRTAVANFDLDVSTPNLQLPDHVRWSAVPVSLCISPCGNPQRLRTAEYSVPSTDTVRLGAC